MKLKTILIVIAVMITASSFGQKDDKPESKVIKKKPVYFHVKPTEKEKSASIEVRLFREAEGIQDADKLGEEQILSIKSGKANLFLPWLNPLKWDVKWSDSTYKNENDLEVEKFFEILSQKFPFGDVVADQTKINARIKPKATGIELHKPKKAFSSIQLLEIYLKIQDIYSTTKKITETGTDANGNEVKVEKEVSILSTNDINNINKILIDFEKLDQKVSRNISKKMEEEFVKLYQLSTFDEANKHMPELNKSIETWQKVNDSIKEEIGEIQKLLELDFIGHNETQNFYIKKSAEQYLLDLKEKAKQQDELIKSMSGFRDTMKASVDRIQSDSKPGYYLDHNIKLPEKNNVRSTFTITYRKIDESAMKIETVSEVFKSEITFEKYSFVQLRVSSGLFYGNSNIYSFGVSSTDSNTLVISSDTVKKHEPVTGLFLNALFDIGANNFAPLVQLGLDPAKTRPFILTGGGFAFPKWDFAVSSGAMFTWEASLGEEKTIGSTVESTSELESLVKFKNFKSIGWYIGLQYKF